jgi:hypothetical protein
MTAISRGASLVTLAVVSACGHADNSQVADAGHQNMTSAEHAAMQAGPPSATDSAFAALQGRGQMAMGVDQYASVHHFDDRSNGGRIALQMKADDTLGTAQIRTHLNLIQHAFEAGDFSTPQFVHLREMPGTAVMAKHRAAIKYSYADLPRGGELRLATSDSDALKAIREFMAAQRGDHRAEGVH